MAVLLGHTMAEIMPGFLRHASGPARTKPGGQP
jgi:hypothetical protein